MSASHTPRRIACLQPSATVILQAVGALDRVVACTRYCADVVPGLVDGRRIMLADSWTAETEQIVAARPNLVIAAVPYQEKAVVEILKGGRAVPGVSSEIIRGHLHRHRDHCRGSRRKRPGKRCDSSRARTH